MHPFEHRSPCQHLYLVNHFYYLCNKPLHWIRLEFGNLILWDLWVTGVSWVPANQQVLQLEPNVPFSKKSKHSLHQISDVFGTTKRVIISILENLKGPCWLLYWHNVLGLYHFKAAKEIWHAILIGKILSLKTKKKPKKRL